ncbi:MAG: hypothetical protein ACXVB9_16995 [Bdellovibrionota bacterium]
MNKNYVALTALLALTLSACNTVPTSRVHAAASVPRFVDVTNYSFTEGEKGPVGMSAGMGYGVGWSDVGNSVGSEIFHVGVSYRTPHVAFGWTPFLGEAQVSHEGTGMFGSALWFAAYFGGGNEWRFSYQNSFTIANKTAEVTGCANDLDGIFGTNCTQSTPSTSRAEVKVKDVGFLFTAEKRVGDHDSFLISPAAYWTYIVTSNSLDSDPASNFIRRTNFWSPGLQVAYLIRGGEKLTTVTTFMLGAQWIKTFRPDRAVRELLPTFDIKFQF